MQYKGIELKRNNVANHEKSATCRRHKDDTHSENQWKQIKYEKRRKKATRNSHQGIFIKLVDIRIVSVFMLSSWCEQRLSTQTTNTSCTIAMNVKEVFYSFVVLHCVRVFYIIFLFNSIIFFTTT